MKFNIEIITILILWMIPLTIIYIGFKQNPHPTPQLALLFMLAGGWVQYLIIRLQKALKL